MLTRPSRACIQARHPLPLRLGNPRMAADPGAGVERSSIAAKIFEHIAAVLEAVHDVREVRGVRQRQGVAGLMQAGQIHDCIAEQLIALRGCGDSRSELRQVRVYLNIPTPLAVQVDHPGIAVELGTFVEPVNTNSRFDLTVDRNEPQSWPSR